MEMEKERAEMLRVLKAYNIRDERVISAMAKVRRHEFIPKECGYGPLSYGNHPCPIGFGQTISQPFIVAYMTLCVEPKAGNRVLEIGAGSGYQSAILAELGVEVYTVEVIPELADHARRVLAGEGYDNVRVLTGDGYKGWPEYSPFDSIIVTCAPEKIPGSLVNQLKEGGRMVVPVGVDIQQLIVLIKKEGEIIEENHMSVRFVPMVHAGAV